MSYMTELGAGLSLGQRKGMLSKIDPLSQRSRGKLDGLGAVPSNNGAPVLVQRRSYGNLPPREAMSGALDVLKKVVKGASDLYQSSKTPTDTGPAPPPPPAQRGFIETYKTPLLVGAVVLGGYLILKRKRR